jgi:copper chaperone CopZ
VNIPCSGHAPLIKGELMKIEGVKSVNFELPNIFEVGYDATATSKEEIMSIGIFKDYPAKEIA